MLSLLDVESPPFPQYPFWSLSLFLVDTDLVGNIDGTFRELSLLAFLAVAPATLFCSVVSTRVWIPAEDIARTLAPDACEGNEWKLMLFTEWGVVG